jgi:hypothetical protein
MKFEDNSHELLIDRVAIGHFFCNMKLDVDIIWLEPTTVKHKESFGFIINQQRFELTNHP